MNLPLVRTLLPVMICLIFLGCVGTLWANESVRVTLNSGVQFDSVTYQVDRIYKVVTLDREGWEKKVSFNDIKSISDQNGTDITASVLGSYRRNSDETWVSENSEIIQKARFKAWNLILSAGGNYSFPMGDYYDGIESGVGYEGDVTAAITENFALRAAVSKSGMKVGPDVYLISLDPDITILSSHIDFSAVRFLITGHFYMHFDKTKKDLSMFYVGSGLGAVSHKNTTTATYRDNPTGSIYREKNSHTDSKFAMTFNVGVIKQVFRKTGLDFAASYDLVTVGTVTNDHGANEVVYAHIFDLKIRMSRYF